MWKYGNEEQRRALPNNLQHGGMGGKTGKIATAEEGCRQAVSSTDKEGKRMIRAKFEYSKDLD